MRAILSAFILPALLAACASAPTAPAVQAMDTTHVAIHADAGKFSEMRVANMNDGLPVEVKLTMTEPHFTTRWLPAARLCVNGDTKTDYACVSLRLKPEDGTISAVAISSFPSEKADQLFTPFHGAFGKQLTMVLKYDARGYTLDLDGQSFPVAPVDFEITGYSFNCSSALCRFDLL
jgi:hypothetical protein